MIHQDPHRDLHHGIDIEIDRRNGAQHGRIDMEGLDEWSRHRTRDHLIHVVEEEKDKIQKVEFLEC